MIAAGKIKGGEELSDNILDQNVSDLLQQGPDPCSSSASTAQGQGSEQQVFSLLVMVQTPSPVPLLQKPHPKQAELQADTWACNCKA